MHLCSCVSEHRWTGVCYYPIPQIKFSLRLSPKLLFLSVFWFLWGGGYFSQAVTVGILFISNIREEVCYHLSRVAVNVWTYRLKQKRGWDAVWWGWLTSSMSCASRTSLAMCDLHGQLSKITSECAKVQGMPQEGTLPVPRFQALPARLLHQWLVTLIPYFLFHVPVPEYSTNSIPHEITLACVLVLSGRYNKIP